MILFCINPLKSSNLKIIISFHARFRYYECEKLVVKFSLWMENMHYVKFACEMSPIPYGGFVSICRKSFLSSTLMPVMDQQDQSGRSLRHLLKIDWVLLKLI